MVHGAPGAWVEQGLKSTPSFLRLVQSDIDAAVASLRGESLPGFLPALRVEAAVTAFVNDEAARVLASAGERNERDVKKYRDAARGEMEAAAVHTLAKPFWTGETPKHSQRVSERVEVCVITYFSLYSVYIQSMFSLCSVYVQSMFSVKVSLN